MKNLKEIPGFSNYLADSEGNIYSKNFNGRKGNLQKMKGNTDSKGYRRVQIKDDKGIKKTHKIHRLIMLVFHGKSELHVNHIDGNKANNNLINLEYCTPLENVTHAISTGLMSVKGKDNPRYINTDAITEQLLIEIFKNEIDWIKYCDDNFGGGRGVIIRLLKSWGYNGKRDFCQKHNIPVFLVSEETRAKLSKNQNHPWKIDRNTITDEQILNFLSNSKKWVDECKDKMGFTFVTLKNISYSKYGTRTMTKVLKMLTEKNVTI
jgi:hypothetical protein